MKKQVLAFSIAVIQILVSFSGISVKAANFENVNEEVNKLNVVYYSKELSFIRYQRMMAYKRSEPYAQIRIYGC